MLKKILAVLALLHAAVALAVDVNTATPADLDGLKGIGPALSRTILDERRKNGEFRNWQDFIARTRGMGAGKAGALSTEGLTVNGAEYPRHPREGGGPKRP